MRQDLVDPAARHHIAAEKQAHAGVKRRVIGFVHRIAARAAGARAPPIPIKLFGAATGARRAGTAHDVASARIGIPARSGSARAARVGDAAEPPAGSLRRGAGRAPSDTRGGCDRGGGRGRAPHLLGAIRARLVRRSSFRRAPRASRRPAMIAIRFSRRRKPWRIDTSRASARFKHRAPGRAIIDHDQFRSGPPAAHVQAMRAPCRRARRPAWAGGFIGVGRRLRRPRARGSRTRARRAHAARDRAGTAGVRRT